MDDRLRKIYMTTTFRIEEPDHDDIVFRVGDLLVPAISDLLIRHAVSSAALITAHNPRSVVLSEDENYARNESLFEKLNARGFETILPADGEAGDWWEPGYLALGLAHEEASEIAREFGQAAYVLVELDRPPELVMLPEKGSQASV